MENSDIELIEQLGRELGVQIEIKPGHHRDYEPGEFYVGVCYDEDKQEKEKDNIPDPSSDRLAILNGANEIIRLYLQDVDLAYVPEIIFELSHLEVLALDHTSFSTIPPQISRLTNLISLYMWGTPDYELRQLPREIAQLPCLKELTVPEHGITSPPKEVVAQGIEAIRNYFDSIDETAEVTYLYEAKMVLVGRGFSGKTSLVKKLTEPGYHLEKDLRSTEGIALAMWDVELPLEKSNSFRFNIWDFGGQQKYDATHQFFITERTLYLFVTEARQESNYLDFDYWLNIVQMMSNDSPVIVVQNKIDERRSQMPTQRYQQQFSNILSFVDTSCADGREDTIEELVEAIKEGIRKLPQVGDQLPKEWVDVREQLESIDANYISYDEYVEICASHGLSGERADFLSRYLHDLGVIVHYHRDTLLQRMVITNPDWAVDGVYAVLDTRGIEENQGRFDNDDLASIWSDQKYEDRRPELLALMKNYQLCFELGTTGKYISPQLLSPNPVTYDAIRKAGRLTFLYQYEFMPAGILTRFIVKKHELIVDDKFWKHGVVVAFEGARALVVEDEISRNVRIDIEGESDRKKDLLAIIRQGFSDIYEKDFNRKIQYDELVPCNCMGCLEEQNEQYFFNWRTLGRYLQSNLSHIRCDNSLIEVNVQELMGEISDTPHELDWYDGGRRMSVEDPIRQETAASINKGNSNWVSLGFGVVWFVLIVTTIFLFDKFDIGKFYSVIAIVAFVITFPLIMSFELLNRKTLSEKGLQGVLKLSYAKVPGLGKFLGS